jgi:hypothetical protein
MNCLLYFFSRKNDSVHNGEKIWTDLLDGWKENGTKNNWQTKVRSSSLKKTR